MCTQPGGAMGAQKSAAYRGRVGLWCVRVKSVQVADTRVGEDFVVAVHQRRKAQRKDTRDPLTRPSDRRGTARRTRRTSRAARAA